MSKEIRTEIFQCRDCGLEVGLRPPVSRPCPNCGGKFMSVTELEMEDEGKDNLYSPRINRIVEKAFPDMIEGLENMLEEESKK